MQWWHSFWLPWQLWIYPWSFIESVPLLNLIPMTVAMTMNITFLWPLLWSLPWPKKECKIVIYDVRSVLYSFRKMTIIVKVNALWVDCCLLASDIFMLKYSTDAAPSPVFTLWEWKQDFQWKCCTEVENILWKMYF